ncbi:hypothetical protein JOQ06_005203, partial [Pogonophryne albipinna]
MHLSILCGSAKPAVKRCTTYCKVFHCPLCPKFKPCAPSRLEKHLEVHLKNGIMFKDMAIYKCHLTCRDLAHFHCPQCAKTIVRRGDMEYALYTILDAPYDFTIIDMPALRKWWCVMLMEHFDLGSHGKMFAHWTETSKPPARKRSNFSLIQQMSQVGKDVDQTMEAPTTKIVQDCKKAVEWVVAHTHLCTRVHLLDAVSTGEAQLREA